MGCNWKLEGIDLPTASVRVYPTSSSINQKVRQSLDDLHGGTQNRERTGRDLPTITIEITLNSRIEPKYDRLRLVTDVLDDDEVWTLEAPEDLPVYLYKNYKRCALSTLTWHHDQDKATGKIILKIDALINGVWIADGGTYCEPVTGHFTAIGVTVTPDASVSENHAKLIGGALRPQLVSSPVGTNFSNAFRFDGANRGLRSQRAISGPPGLPSGSFSLEARFKYMKRPATFGYICGFGINAEDSSYCYITVNSADKFEVWVRGTASAFSAGTLTHTAVLGQTYSLELSWNGFVYQLLIDGVNQSLFPSTGINDSYGVFDNANDKGFGIGGADADDAANVFPVGGIIDEVRWSNTARLNSSPETSPFTVDAQTLHLYHMDSMQSFTTGYELGDSDACDIADNVSFITGETGASTRDSANGHHLLTSTTNWSDGPRGPESVGASPFFDKYGRGYNFTRDIALSANDVRDTYFQSTDPQLYITGDLTLMAAFKVVYPNPGAVDRTILECYDAADGSIAYKLRLIDNNQGTQKLFIQHTDNAGSGVAIGMSGHSGFLNNQEVAIAVVRNTASSQFEFWVDGFLQAIEPYTVTPGTGTTPVMRVGQNEAKTAGLFTNELYELRIWDSIVTPDILASLTNKEDDTYRSRIVGTEVAAYFFGNVGTGLPTPNLPLLELPAQTDGYPLAIRASDYQEAQPTLYSTSSKPSIDGLQSLPTEIYDLTGFLVPLPDEPCEAGLFEVCSSPSLAYLNATTAITAQGVASQAVASATVGSF